MSLTPLDGENDTAPVVSDEYVHAFISSALRLAIDAFADCRLLSSAAILLTAVLSAVDMKPAFEVVAAACV